MRNPLGKSQVNSKLWKTNNVELLFSVVYYLLEFYPFWRVRKETNRFKKFKFQTTLDVVGCILKIILLTSFSKKRQSTNSTEVKQLTVPNHNPDSSLYVIDGPS